MQNHIYVVPIKFRLRVVSKDHTKNFTAFSRLLSYKNSKLEMVVWKWANLNRAQITRNRRPAPFGYTLSHLHVPAHWRAVYKSTEEALASYPQR